MLALNKQLNTSSLSYVKTRDKIRRVNQLVFLYIHWIFTLSFFMGEYLSGLELTKWFTSCLIFLFSLPVFSLFPVVYKCPIYLLKRRKLSLLRVLKKLAAQKNLHQNKSTSEVSVYSHFSRPLFLTLLKYSLECIVYTWDHRTSAIIWNILKVQPLLSDEVQAFKALILVHKIVKDGHPNV